jgi:AraC-like DNA-binding protein
MIFRQHVPAEPLASYVDHFWFYEDLFPSHQREHVLPDGTFELIINLRDDARHTFDRYSGHRTLFRDAWFSGAHSRYIVIDALPGSSMIGVHFKPGGAAAVLGLPADELRDRVVELDAIWGAAAGELREQLLSARGPAAKFNILEHALRTRVASHHGDTMQQRRVFWARDRFMAGADTLRIGDIADQLGVSHKHFIDEFRRHVGLTPKLFCRIRRFQDVLARVTRDTPVNWADIACACGYFDQAHFVHDFRAFSGLTPTRYESHNGIEHINFVPIAEPR